MWPPSVVSGGVVQIKSETTIRARAMENGDEKSSPQPRRTRTNDERNMNERNEKIKSFMNEKSRFPCYPSNNFDCFSFVHVQFVPSMFFRYINVFLKNKQTLFTWRQNLYNEPLYWKKISTLEWTNPTLVPRNQKWTKMNETWTNHERKFLPDVHERNRACFVHVRFVHERYLPILFLSFVFGRTNEKSRIFPFMFIVRSSLGTTVRLSWLWRSRCTAANWNDFYLKS